MYDGTQKSTFLQLLYMLDVRLSNLIRMLVISVCRRENVAYHHSNRIV